ncbi:MAG: ECF transporter S component [Clostridia bacterium]|nr:ECF transporter S component [Clostridia bacterium]
MKNTTKQIVLKITLGGLLLALGVLIPQVFHVFGQQAGSMFLPMHLSVLIAGFFLGGTYGSVIGAVTPLLSFLFTGMPPAARLVFMMIELAVYGGASGLFYKKLKLNIYISLILSQLCGRTAYYLSLITAAHLIGMNIPTWAAVVDATVTGLPGIVLQIAVVPIVVIALKKGVALNDR